MTKQFGLKMRDDCPASSATDIKILLKFLVKLSTKEGDAYDTYVIQHPEAEQLVDKFVEYYKGEL